MKMLLLALAVYCQSIELFAQSPVTWQFSAKKIADKKYEVHLTPTVAAPWHMYSQTSPEGGAIPTTISFNKNPLLTIEGTTKEVGTVISKYEDVFGVTVKYFSGSIDFVQVVTTKRNVKTNITGSVEFMVCNDKECLPPKTIAFTIKL